jgi:hypothetical protein
MTRGVTRLSQIAGLAALFVFVLSSGSAGATGGVAPNPVNMLDCNGLSQAYQALKPTMGGLCTDPFASWDGEGYRAYDNGKYIGHDEPSVKFVSSAPDSGNTMTYLMQLGVDPKKNPTPDGKVSDYAELSIAPWFGLPMCDPNSYPQNPCTPDSDANTGLGAPTDAGSAFMELQFYPPGFGPFQDAFSCDSTYYCAALTIDSLACTYGFASCNPNCFEPVNFAYVQRDGIPTGPPSPQLADEFTLAPNGQTLLMNQGDALRVGLEDTPDGFKVTVDDLTTGQSGFMVASAANGFMSTDPGTCDGTPFAFHPEYDTAAPQNQVPWAALEGGVLMQQEIGHFESCDKVANPIGFIAFDPQTYENCIHGVDRDGGEGPCTFGPSSIDCQGATTEGNKACTVGNLAGLCEYADALCAPKGPRTLSLVSEPAVWSWPVAGCEQSIFQNGDLDFDGNSYRRVWPDGSKDHPQPFTYAGPFDSSGNPYPSVQFETDVGGSENDCDTDTGAHCEAPPHGAAFYPFWTIGRQDSPFDTAKGKVCLWNFGDRIKGVTSDDLGGTRQYGAPNTARYGGTLISAVQPNPQLSSKCKQVKGKAK